MHLPTGRDIDCLLLAYFAFVDDGWLLARNNSEANIMLVSGGFAFSSAQDLQEFTAEQQAANDNTVSSSIIGAIESKTALGTLDPDSHIFESGLWTPKWQARALLKLFFTGFPVCIVGDSDVVVNQVLGKFKVDSALQGF